MDFPCPKTKEEINDYLKTRVDSLDLSNRTNNALVSASIRTIGGIVRKSGLSLLEIDGLGKKGVEEIQKALSEMFDFKTLGNDFKFIPKYTEVGSSFSNTPPKEQTLEEKIKEYSDRIEIGKIEEKYFDKQEEKKFIYETKIISFEFSSKVETILLSNNILTVGDILDQDLESIKEKYYLNSEEINSVIDTVNYLNSRNKKIEEEQEELRKKEIELIGHLNYQLEKKRSLIVNEYKKIPTRNLDIFNSFRKGLTLEQIGKENKVTRERVRQIIRSTLGKMGLDYEEEKSKISLERNKGKPKKVIKDKKWGARKYDFCIVCNTTEFSHSRNGVCERCSGSFSGEIREKIILSHNNKCDNCNTTRSEVTERYKHDFFITKKQEVFCRMCFLWKTGKKLGDSRKDQWKKFYKNY